MTKTLELLGYAPDDRVLIIHADDAGSSHAANVAAFESLAHGSLTCASALVPAPWFAETADLLKQHPGADMGVHTTLTAECRTYRWRSLSGHAALHAPDGGMWRDLAGVVRAVTPDIAAAELRAQVEHALASGVDVTHLDTHMGAVLLPQYMPPYVDLAIEFRLPLFFIRPSEGRLAALGDGARVYAEQSSRLESLGWPLLDHMIIERLSQVEPDEKEEGFRELFAALRPGLTHFLVHPARGGEELEAMMPDDYRHRASEYEVFRKRDLRDYCEGLGIKLTGYREIRDRLRASLPA